ncbi:OsmC family protein [Psychrosphaera sp. F3M07]|jgi:putative redox protein|uniref:OsmC family protein n=1 Tax=Psychrosphaera aquimarina TaxID=2044854 RepID=A0ABU3R379_9GAMM|nr:MULTISPECIES: OsmC family protein [Psychrosphaera]MBU2917550.1 OsmC family protein [Psychrosphaera sp. F3M07]MDU0114136.1 OsmC family protein [Psychrosphaera aquimarina]
MKAKVSWIDGMAFVGHSETGHKIVMDGDREGGAPSPMEMVLMSAGTCSAIDVVSILEKARQNIQNVDVELSAERAETVPKVFTTIHLHFVVTGTDVAEKHVERAVNLSADKYCSVAKMLEKAATITHSFEIKQA